MDYWYFLVLVSIVLVKPPSVRTMNFGLRENNYQMEKRYNKINPVLSFKNNSYDSGVLFTQLSRIRLSEREFEVTYNIDISHFINRIQTIKNSKIELEEHCLKLEKNCTTLINAFTKYINFGELTIKRMSDNDTIKTVPHEILNSSNHQNNQNKISAPIDEMINNITFRVEHIMHEQINDADYLMGLFIRLDATNIHNVFPGDVIMKYYNDMKFSLMKDEEFPLDLPIEDPYSIFLISSFKATYNNNQISIHILTPTVKKQKFTLFESIPIHTKLGNRLVSIKTSPYFLFNAGETEFIPLNDTKLCLTHLDQETRICRLGKSQFIKQYNSCESLIFKNTKNIALLRNTCFRRRDPPKNQIIQISTQKIFHCIIHKPFNFNILCRDNSTHNYLITNSGILHMNSNCFLNMRTTSNLTVVDTSNLVYLEFNLVHLDIIRKEQENKANFPLYVINNSKPSIGIANVPVTRDAIQNFLIGTSKTIIQTSNTVGQIISKTNSIIGKTATDVSGKITNEYHNLGNSLSNIDDFLLDTANSIGKNLKGTGTSIWNEIQNLANDALKSIGQILLYILYTIIGIFVGFFIFMTIFYGLAHCTRTAARNIFSK